MIYLVFALSDGKMRLVKEVGYYSNKEEALAFAATLNVTTKIKGFEI